MTANLTRAIEEVRAQTDQTLDRLLPPATEPPERLREAMRYSVFAGGKRVRPLLAVLAGEALGAARPSLLHGGAAIELIHTFSLVHDDLPALDDDDLRRGRATLHRSYDEATAILAGDALLALGLTVLAGGPPGIPAAQRVAAVALVGAAVGGDGMIGGQVDDLRFEGGRWPQEAEAALERLHGRKTGRLIQAAVRLGGLYAGAGVTEDGLLAELGSRIGLLFQIADDILDVEGDSEVLGKRAGKDASLHKLTYPSLLGVEESRRRLEVLEREALELAVQLPDRGGLLPELIHYLARRDR
ncbi:MAG: polyprenyl synthetase family protein [Thermoanaerobaculia bacterium]